MRFTSDFFSFGFVILSFFLSFLLYKYVNVYGSIIFCCLYKDYERKTVLLMWKIRNKKIWKILNNYYTGIVWWLCLDHGFNWININEFEKCSSFLDGKVFKINCSILRVFSVFVLYYRIVKERKNLTMCVHKCYPSIDK